MNAITQTPAAARDAGIARAVGHADRVNGNWSERAFGALRRLATTNEFFTAEVIRRLAVEIEPPPDARAWGGVFQRAARAGLVVHHGWGTMLARDCHCSPTRVWRSALYRAE